MPCRSEHMEPTAREVEMSRVMSLLDEFQTSPGTVNQKHFSGYHPHVYNKTSGVTQSVLDRETGKLCALCKASVDLSKYSLELQMWWRDHQRADQARALREMEEEKRRELQESGVAKLTEQERIALGISLNTLGR